MTAGPAVLLVDDDSGDVLLLQEAFRELRLPYEVTLCSDGEAALKLLSSDDYLPDLIVLDLNLPRRTGREVYGHIRSQERLKAVPVAILTTSKTDDDIIDGADPALNCYLTKPMRLDGVLQTARRLDEFFRAFLARGAQKP